MGEGMKSLAIVAGYCPFGRTPCLWPGGRNRHASATTSHPSIRANRTTRSRRFARSSSASVGSRDAVVVTEGMEPSLRTDLSGSFTAPRSEFGGREHEVWGELEQLLALGGAFTTTRGAVKGRREFCAPYVFTEYPQPPPEDLRYEGHPWVILRPRVPVRASAMDAARGLGELSHDLVKVTGETDTNSGKPRWRQIITPGGEVGWVAAADIRDPQDPHACFARIGERWMMVQFSRSMPGW
jgi:hypothetical protein